MVTRDGKVALSIPVCDADARLVVLRDVPSGYPWDWYSREESPSDNPLGSGAVN
jgi:hypothetical protein